MLQAVGKLDFRIAFGDRVVTPTAVGKRFQF
jgi:hypothetical protein